MHRKARDELKKYIQEDRALASRSLDAIKKMYSEAGMKVGSRTLPAYLSANFLSASQFESIRQQAESIAGVLGKIADHICSEPDPGASLDPYEEQYRLFPPGRGCRAGMIMRLDMFFDGTSLKLVEYNCESPSGMGRISLIDKIFRDIPQLEMFRRRIMPLPDIMHELAGFTMKSYRDDGGRKRKPAIAFVDWKDVRTIADQEYIISNMNSVGLRAFGCEPGNLRYENSRLFYGQEQIDIVFRRVIAKELLARKDECRDFINALKDGKVCVINPGISIILNDKRILHHLSRGDFDMLLDEDEIRLVRGIVPWTRGAVDRTALDPGGRKVRLSDFILENRERLVLKPGRGYGGEEVVLGCEVSDNVWKKTRETAFAEQDWVVQEYVDIPQIDVFGTGGFERKYINLSPFVIGGNLSGFFTRVSESKIINISRKGGLIPTYVLKG